LERKIFDTSAGSLCNLFLDQNLHTRLLHLQSLGVTERQVGIPATVRGDLLVKMQRLGNQADYFVYRCVDVRKVLQIEAKSQLSYSLRAEFQHVNVYVPRLTSLVELVENLECLLDSLLHRRRVMADCLRAKSRRQKLVRDLPLRSVCVAQENTCFRGLDAEQRMSLVDLLCEKVRLGKCNGGNVRVVGVIDGTTHVCGLEERAVLFEEALMVAQVIWEHFEEVADVRKSLGTRYFADCVAIYGDRDGILRR
jgi:hypothetical protein